MSSVVRNALPLIVTATFLSACGGGGGSIPPAKTAAKTTIAPGQGTLALTISIPHPAAASASKRSAAYISSSTKSIAITIASTAPVLQEAVGLTPASNPNCTTVSSTTTCGITIPLSAGSFSATFATYDGPVVSGAATGNLLSQGQSIPITITAGQTNTVTATLDGVPTSITIAPSSGSTITGTQSGGFTVPFSAQGLTIEALDADGNVILGAGAPTFTVTATATKYTVTQPASGTPNQITLESATGGSGTLSVTATPPDGGFSCSTSGIVCSASATLSSAMHTLAVANQSNVTVYQSADNLTWTLIATVSYPVMSPSEVALAFASNGTLFIAAQPMGPGSKISAIAAPYSGTATTITNDVSSPTAMAVTSSNELLVADGYVDLDAYAAPYTGTPSRTVLSSFNPGSGVVLDGNGDAILSASYGGTWLLAAPFTSVTTTINGSVGGPEALDASGNLFVGDENNGGEFFEYAPPYTGTPVTVPLSGGNFPKSMAVDANGNLWVADSSYTVYEFVPPFSSVSTPITSQGITSTIVAADSSGDVIVPTSSSTLSILNGTVGTVGTITTSINSPKAFAYLK